MTQRKGTISVETNDIFPIIKKWLYSEHDIFLRELIANATDAITKRATIARTQNMEVPTGNVSISVNEENKTITIKDNGIGMTEAEVEKYIAQLAFSGAKEFVAKLEEQNDKDADIIGKFGLGFYSAFMVSDKVQVNTLSMEEGAKAVKWTCEGETEYIFEDSDKNEVGTEITLFINEESKEFLNNYKVQDTLRQHCDFMPYPIEVLGTKKDEEGKEEETRTQVNNTTPIWKRNPSELKDQDYIDFYREKFPMDGEPLFWIHLKVDHPFTLDGVLFFPKINPNKPFNESNIRLYCRQVFVSDNVKNIIPEFLSLLKGHIDSSDIPLNVSRSSLQGDPNIQKISNYIIKKVSEALKKLYRKDREKYEAIWQDSGLFIKYGCISDPKFDEVMRDMVIFKNSEDKYMTLTEYQESIPEKYKEKMKDLVLYFEKGKSDQTLRTQLKSEGIQVIETDEYIDPHFLQNVEMKKQGENTIRFAELGSEISNILESDNATEDDMKVKDLFQNVLFGKKEEAEAEKEDSKDIEITKIKNSKYPAFFKVDEQMKRFSQMTKNMGGMANQNFPVKKTLVINPNNSLIQNALKIHEKGGKTELVEKLCHHVKDLATISSEGLKNEDKDVFVTRTQELMEELTQLAL